MSNNNTQKQNNVFVGISLQKELIDKELMEKILDIARNCYYAKRVNFFIADDIDKINRRILYRQNESRMSKEIDKEVDSLTAHLSSLCQPSIIANHFVLFSRWNDVLTNSYWRLFMHTKKLFLESQKLRDEIGKIVTSYLIKRGSKPCAETITYASEYILHEIPIMLQGIDFNGHRYQKMIYPRPGPQPLDSIVKNIRNGKYGRFKTPASQCEVRRVEIE